MRLFVSLRPPPEAARHLLSACAELRTSRVEQWHVTLTFLGEVPDAAPLHEPLARVAAAARPLALRLRGSGSFFGAYWVGVDGDLEGLHALADGVAAAAREAGVRLEQRRYRPHLTVARRASGDPLRDYEGQAWTASELDLVRSVLGQRAEHTAVQTHRLGGS